MVPVQKWWQAPYFWAGTKAYDFLAGSEGIESSYFMTKSKTVDAFPMLKRDNVIGAMVYYGEYGPVLDGHPSGGANFTQTVHTTTLA